MQDVLPLLNGRCSFQTVDGTEHTIDDRWDMIIAHPPCTYLTTCANRAFSLRCTDAESVVKRWESRTEAAIFFMQFVAADCDKIAIENPNGCMNTMYRKPDCIIHPYYFAESESDSANYVQKKTCIWLKNLPPLQRTNDLPVPPPKYICQGEKTKGKHIGWCEGMSGIRGGQKERAKARSKTFPGVAKAMAEQWGGIAHD
jgi:hypothetical protein